MEFASFLAGEKWSDQPKCTHPLLGLIARLVNDTVDGPHRERLVPMIPDVVGLNSPDIALDVLLAMRMIEAGLPIAPYERQRLLALGLVVIEGILPSLPDDLALDVHDRIRAAFATAPDTEAWARAHRLGPQSEKALREKTFPGVAINAGLGVARACIDDPQGRLVELLSDCIADARAYVGAPAPDPNRAPVTWPVRDDDVAARDPRDASAASRLWSLVRG